MRSNIYDATSGIETVSTGKDEEAMDGWDMRLDYHLPIKANARIFAGLFEFENAAGSYELEGEKYGLNVIGNNFDLEIGYIDDNKTGDGSFANLSYVMPLGNNSSFSNNSSNYFEYTSVAERLYEPVKRENKIRVVSTTLNVKASGFLDNEIQIIIKIYIFLFLIFCSYFKLSLLIAMLIVVLSQMEYFQAQVIDNGGGEYCASAPDLMKLLLMKCIYVQQLQLHPQHLRRWD